LKVLAILIVLTGLVIAIAPQYTNCEAQGGTMPTAVATAPLETLSHATTFASVQTTVATTIVPKMKCLWSARGALAVGAALAVAGALLFFARRKETRRALGIVSALLGASAILLPTTLIGTCGSAAAVCNTTMKPIMLVAGGLAVAASLVLVVVNELGREDVTRVEAGT
jgi:predicted membrane channel-forming protein YqfA (hemolysin III family)